MRIAIQSFVFLLAVALISFDIYTILEYYVTIGDPYFNPRDGQASFVRIGVYLGTYISFIVAAIFAAVNFFATLNKEKSIKWLMTLNYILLISTTLILPIFRFYAF